MPAARLPEPCSAPPGAWEHLRGAQGLVLPPLHPPPSRAHPLAGSPEAWPRDSSWGGVQGGGLTEGPRSAPSPPRVLDGHRARYGDEDAGAPAHRISLGKRGAEKSRSGSEERETFQNREGWEGKRREGWERSLEKRVGSAWGDSRGAVGVPSECPVGSEAAWWGEAAAPPSPGSPAPLPFPPCSCSPSSGCSRSRTGDGGWGMRWCGRRGVVRGRARCTPGVVVPVGDPGGRGRGRGRGRDREGWGGRPGELPAPAGLARSSGPAGPELKLSAAYLGPAQPLTPLGRCVPSRGSGSFLKEKVIKGAGWRAEFPGSSAIPRPTGDFSPTSCASQWALLSRRHSSPFTLRPGPTFPPESTIQLPLQSPPLYLL